jgi:hypothetical protein
LQGSADLFELITGEDDKVFAYLLIKETHKVLVLLNLMPYDKVHCTITHQQLSGAYYNLFSAIHHRLNNTEKFELQAWEYIVYVSDNKN